MIALVPASALVLALARQTPAPGRILDGVAAQAGDDVVTLSQYQRQLRRATESDPPQSREEQVKLQRDVLLALQLRCLEEQRGRDLGLDPAQIGRIRRGLLEEEREHEGLETFLAKLRAEGSDALSNESEKEADILRYMWSQSALGQPYGGKRATQDEFVRPGEVREFFERFRGSMGATTVQLRFLMIASEHAGSAEAARQACEDARARVEAGEELAAIVDERGDAMRETHGLMPFTPAELLTDPDLRVFARDAAVGALSAIGPVVNPKTRVPDPEFGFRLVQLVDRRVPPPPEFASRDIQRRVNDAFSKNRQENLLGRARQRLLSESYSWVTPLITGPTTPPAR